MDDIMRFKKKTQSLNLCLCFLVSVLSIHKRPVKDHAEYNFPMKGWKGMVDWARSSEDKVTVPKNILPPVKPGESWKTHNTTVRSTVRPVILCQHFASYCEHDNVLN